jgi:hypothetical protein
MSTDLSSNPDVIATMEAYLESERPPVEIRPQLDIGYELVGQGDVREEPKPMEGVLDAGKSQMG